MSEANGQMITLEDLGFITVKIGDVEQRLDLYEVNGQLLEILHNAKDKTDVEFHGAVAELLKVKGYPACSQFVANRFAKAIFDQYEALKKKADPEPALPASTDSIPLS